MSDFLRRVSIHTGQQNRFITVDLALPSAVVIAELLPAIVDTVGIAHRETAARWRLARIAGAALDDSRTLSESGVRDGDILLLSRYDPPPPRFGAPDLATAVADTASDGPSTRLLTSAAAAWTVAAGVLAAAYAGAGTAMSLVALAALAAATGAAAIVADRVRPDPWLCLTSNHAAVLLTGVLGYRIVPVGPAAANFLLAAAAATVASILLLRIVVRESVSTTAVAALGSVATLALGAATALTLPPAAVGALLAVLGLTALGLAARLSVLLAGLSPSGRIADLDDDPDQRAVRGRRILTALIWGASAAILLGAFVVTIGGIDEGAPWQVDAALCVAVGLTLLLRSRSHAGGWSRTALVITGMSCLTMSLATALLMTPGYELWVAVATVVAGSAALSPVTRSAAGPVAARAVDTLEYVALTAVIPAACWVIGLFAAVRGWQLP